MKINDLEEANLQQVVKIELRIVSDPASDLFSLTETYQKYFSVVLNLLKLPVNVINSVNIVHNL